MTEHGHEVLVVASKKDVTEYLLNHYGINHKIIGSYGGSLLNKILMIPVLDIRMLKVAKEFKPDLIIGSVRATHASKFLGVRVIDFVDDDYSFRFTYPLLDSLVGFSGLEKNAERVIKINSYKELAYLHPKYFKPNKKNVELAGIRHDEPYSLLRFVNLNAYHDIGKKGFDNHTQIKLIERLEKFGKVYISYEGRLPENLRRYQLPVTPDKIHDLLFYANLFVSDSQTMTTEAAVLGTPAIRCNSFVGDNDMRNFIELEEKYQLIYNFSDPEGAIEKATELMATDGLRELWQEKRKRLLADKLDVTEFMVCFVENYPESFHTLKREIDCR